MKGHEDARARRARSPSCWASWAPRRWACRCRSIPDALSKGTIDGCVIPWEVVPSVKVQELTKYHAEFDPAGGALYTTTFVMAMNKAKYNSLPPDLKKVIDANSGLATSAWLGKVQQAGDAAGRKTASRPQQHHLHRRRRRGPGVPPQVPSDRSGVGGRHEQEGLRRQEIA